MSIILKTTSVIALAGALAMTMAVSAQAGTVTKPLAKGIGFANSEAGATGRAIRAWTKAVRHKYGNSFTNYNKSRSQSLSCDYIGRSSRSFSKRRGAVGVEGDPSSKWTCIAKARPVGKTYGEGPKTRNMTGIGFGQRKWSARSKAVKAWRTAARDRYGRAFDKYFFAANKRVRCERIGFGAKRTRSAVVIGNPNAPWTCTAKGRPRSLLSKLY